MTAADSERIRRVASPAAESTSLAPSGSAASSIEDDNIEDGDSGVGNDASNFGERIADKISNTRDDDEVIDGVIERGDRNDKCCIFKDGTRAKNDILDFGDSSRWISGIGGSNEATNKVIVGEDSDSKNCISKYGNDDGAGAENKTLDFSDGVAGEII